MAQSGRESAASLAVVRQLPTGRPPPPAELTEGQATEWRAVVGAMPVDWFKRKSHATLANYCRHVCRSQWLAGQADVYGDKILKGEGGVATLDRLLGMIEREDRASLAHARSLRITHQARYDARAAGNATTNAAAGSFY